MAENSTIFIKLKDGNGKSLGNETLHVKLKDENNNILYDNLVKTHTTGVAIVELKNVSTGNYSIEVTFEGNENHTPCSISQKITVQRNAIEEDLLNSTLIQDTIADTQSSSSSSSPSHTYYVPPSDSGSSDSGDRSDSRSDSAGDNDLPEYDSNGKQIN